MANDEYDTVSNCSACASNSSGLRLKRKRQHFSAGGPLVFIAINVLRSLLRTTKENQHVTVINDRNTKLTRAVPAGSRTAAHKANVF